MQQVVQAAIEQQVLRAATEVEAALDAQLQELENLDPDDIEALRQRRVLEMKRWDTVLQWPCQRHTVLEGPLGTSALVRVAGRALASTLLRRSCDAQHWVPEVGCG